MYISKLWQGTDGCGSRAWTSCEGITAGSFLYVMHVTTWSLFWSFLIFHSNCWFLGCWRNWTQAKSLCCGEKFQCRHYTSCELQIVVIMFLILFTQTKKKLMQIKHCYVKCGIMSIWNIFHACVNINSKYLDVNEASYCSWGLAKK